MIMSQKYNGIFCECQIIKRSEDVSGEDKYGFRRERRTMGAVVMLRITSGRTSDIHE